MELFALVASEEHVCCRYRLAAFRPALEAEGHRLHLGIVPRTWQDWSRVLIRARQADVVIVQRHLLPPWSFLGLRTAARRLVFDFDDAIFMNDSYDPRGLHNAARLRRFGATVGRVDAVVAGNAFLLDVAQRWARAIPLQVIPTCVDPRRYSIAQHDRATQQVDLVWVGSGSTLQGLKHIQTLLEQIGQHCPGVCLKLICDRFLELEHLPVKKAQWAEATEAEELASADIGISWLPEDRWSRGKCGLKILQYCAAGLPVIANPVGTQPVLVRHGLGGILARTVDDWVEGITRLSRDPALRRRMGAVNRRLVEDDYSVGNGARAWLELLHRLRRSRVA